MIYNFGSKAVVLAIIVLFVEAGVTLTINMSVKANSRDGLIAYWSFDEGSGDIAYDGSGHGNDGTIYGASWTSGVSGHALSFDGYDDFVDVGYLPQLQNTDELTVSCWIYKKIMVDMKAL